MCSVAMCQICKIVKYDLFKSIASLVISMSLFFYVNVNGVEGIVD